MPFVEIPSGAIEWLSLAAFAEAQATPETPDPAQPSSLLYAQSWCAIGEMATLPGAVPTAGAIGWAVLPAMTDLEIFVSCKKLSLRFTVLCADETA